ncbi:MAG: sarcosine/dimethylglycine N-methyltransferase [Verrucomicrobiales bacterium]|jgi:sarcosine/dimethylglycine N-methyltransferase
MTDIKSMGLYRNVDRILADLASDGFGADDPLSVDDLSKYDQYHYEGTDAVDDAIHAIGVGSESVVLDVGSGLGGPARYIADHTGARVTALELQADLDATAALLTERCGLSAQVEHRNGNVLNGDAPTNTFTGLVSMLCFLHIPDRAKLFTNCAASLRSGGVMFIDDYVELAPLQPAERDALASTVYCTYLPDTTTYVRDVTAAGFTDVEVVDKTAQWTEFVNDRLVLFRANRSALIERYDAPTVDGLDHFYSTVVDLFGGGRLGGLRLIARLPDAD